MEVFKKPPEYLGNKEKEVIDLCSEIITWSSKDKNIFYFFEKSKIREKATELYEKLNKMDFENDDKYYQIYEIYDSLLKEYKELKEKAENKVKENEKYQIDFFKFDKEELIKKIFEEVKINKKFVGVQYTDFDFWKHGGYGDYIELQILKSDFNENEFAMIVEELWNYDFFENKPTVDILKKNFENKFPFKFDFNARQHDFDSAYDFWFKINNIPEDEAEEILKFIIENIKENPRVLKNKKLNYNE
ncbi:MAG: hypothetical protein WC414_01420 [Patescibacteria group bacterium]